MDISINPITNSPEVHINENDYNFILQQIKRRFHRKEKDPFSICKDKYGLIKSLYNSVNYLIKDQIKPSDEGKGGWGYSDKAYMNFLYGEKEASSMTDSVMTSVVAFNALKKYKKVTEYFDKTDNIVINIKEILNKASEYFLLRWNAKKGFGGTIKSYGREAEYKLVDSYRHTGWLLRVWLTDPHFHDRVIKTANYLINNFDEEDLMTEKVATEIAVYTSLQELLYVDLFQTELDFDKIKLILWQLESNIIKKYTDEIHGWTSGNNAVNGRQLYTLFTLAELIKLVKKGSPIHILLNNVYKKTFSDSSGYILDNGMTQYKNGPQDINTSCLAISVLNRKGNLDKYEKKLFQKMCEYLICKLSDIEFVNDSNHEALYSWTLSYFINDLCDYLLTNY